MKEETPQQPVCDVGLTTEHNTEVCYHAGRPECHKCSRPIGGLEEDSAPKESEPQWEKEFDKQLKDWVIRWIAQGRSPEHAQGVTNFITGFFPTELKQFISSQLEKLIDSIPDENLVTSNVRDMAIYADNRPLKAQLRKDWL